DARREATIGSALARLDAEVAFEGAAESCSVGAGRFPTARTAGATTGATCDSGAAASGAPILVRRAAGSGAGCVASARTAASPGGRSVDTGADSDGGGGAAATPTTVRSITPPPPLPPT